MKKTTKSAKLSLSAEKVRQLQGTRPLRLDQLVVVVGGRINTDLSQGPDLCDCDDSSMDCYC